MSMFYVQQNGKELGPLSADQLKAASKKGRISKETLIRKSESEKWYPAHKVKGLFSTSSERNLPSTVPSLPVENSIIVPPVVNAQPVASNIIECPFCGEEIKQSAKKCRHCGEILDIMLSEIRSSKQTSASPVIQITNTNTNTNIGSSHKRWNSFVAMLLSLIIPGLGQLYKGQPLNAIIWFIIVAIGYVPLVIPGLVLHLCCVIGAGMGDPYK